MAIDDLPTVDNLPNADELGFDLVRVSAATTISFTATSTIADSANGLGRLLVGEKLVISGAGAGANAGLAVTVATVAAGSITVEETTITGQSAGGAVTLTRQSESMPGLGHQPAYEGLNSGSPQDIRR